ncbi:MAG: hypothetical protein IKA87_10290 [Lentisphaeria bacterium]|nr:hypothetical protein [Lentisphaeria bacterium]
MQLKRKEKGQVILEFVIMLVITVVLALALLTLSGAISDDGERMVNLVRLAVP